MKAGKTLVHRHRWPITTVMMWGLACYAAIAGPDRMPNEAESESVRSVTNSVSHPVQESRSTIPYVRALSTREGEVKLTGVMDLSGKKRAYFERIKPDGTKTYFTVHEGSTVGGIEILAGGVDTKDAKVRVRAEGKEQWVGLGKSRSVSASSSTVAQPRVAAGLGTNVGSSPNKQQFRTPMLSDLGQVPVARVSNEADDDIESSEASASSRGIIIQDPDSPQDVLEISPVAGSAQDWSQSAGSPPAQYQSPIRIANPPIQHPEESWIPEWKSLGGRSPYDLPTRPIFRRPPQ